MLIATTAEGVETVELRASAATARVSFPLTAHQADTVRRRLADVVDYGCTVALRVTDAGKVLVETTHVDCGCEPRT